MEQGNWPMKSFSTVCAIAIAIAGCAAAPLAAQTAPQADGFARLGVARVRLADEGKIFIMGTFDPNADYKTPVKWVANFDLGYFVASKFALQVSATSPMTTPNLPTGSLLGTPNLGNDKFSIFSLTGTFHPLRGGSFSPYIGGGLAWQHVWSVKDAAAQNLKIDDTVGPVIQAGVDVPLGQQFGLFFDARKAFYKTDASASLGPVSITAKPELDPLILTAGATIRF